MENEKTARDYKETKQNAKEFYTSIGMVWCPALKDRVVFNRLGFQHLIRPKNIERPRREQRKRFALLPIARNIIENDDAITKRHQKVTTHIVKIHGARIPIRSYVNYWEFTERSDGRIIKVIIRQFPGGRKHFLSVYERKEKSRP